MHRFELNADEMRPSHTVRAVLLNGLFMWYTVNLAAVTRFEIELSGQRALARCPHCMAEMAVVYGDDMCVQSLFVARHIRLALLSHGMWPLLSRPV